MEQRLHSVLSGLFGLFGLALACLGIYGVMSCSVSYRLRELGVRTAGVLFSVGLALTLTRLVSSVLYGVSSAEPLTFLTLPAVLAVVGLAAAWARRGELDGWTPRWSCKRSRTIVGVLDEDMEFGQLSEIDLWTPIPLLRGSEQRDRRDFWATALLAPGATADEADHQVAALGQRLAAEHPRTHGGWTAYVETFNEGLMNRGFWTVLVLLGITVAFVMLIACSNVATLMLSRATARAREIAIRSALGAGRLRLVRQMLTESVLLSLLAALLGLGLTRAALDGLVWVAGNNDVNLFFKMLTVDRHVVAFTLAVALLAPLLFGLGPALWACHRNAFAALKEGGTGGATGAQRGQRFLVAAQVTLALALMLVSGLPADPVDGRRLDVGPDHILTLPLDQ